MASSSHALCDDALAEILAWLPSEAVLRCRAVCKRWRRVTTDPSFLSAHAGRRPREMITVTEQLTLSAVPLSPDLQDPDDGERHLCDPKLRDGSGKWTGRWCGLVTSLDGLLVLQQRPGLFVVCNPATRQWANLPALAPSPCSTAGAYSCGFYLHGPSGEYRLLCHGVVDDDHDDDGGWKDHYYTLSAGAAAPRRLARAPLDADRDGYELAVARRRGTSTLYWYCRHPESERTGKMLAFRTGSETFRLVSRPPCDGASAAVALLELDGALCAAALRDDDRTLLELWALQEYYDYDHETEEEPSWTLRHRVVLPRPRLDVGYMSAAIVAGDGVILVGHPGSSRVVRLCDVKGNNNNKPHRELRFRSAPALRVFSESLVTHHFFSSPRCPGLLAPIKFAH